MLAALVPAMLVIAQPDLGSGLVYIAVAFACCSSPACPGGTSRRSSRSARSRSPSCWSLAPAAGVQVLNSYQARTPHGLPAPLREPRSKAYQQQQSKIAIGSGQKIGRGAGRHADADNFVPEDETDFIFAAVGERYGFAGAALVLSLYALMIWRTLRIVAMAKNLFGALDRRRESWLCSCSRCSSTSAWRSASCPSPA